MFPSRVVASLATLVAAEAVVADSTADFAADFCASVKLVNASIVDVAALYEYLPGRGSDRQAAPLASAPKLVLKGDPARMVTPCAACHGTSARGNPNGQVPVLHGQQDSAIETALRDYRSGARTSDMLMEMRQFSKALTDEEIKELARWYAGQPGRPAQEQK